LLLLCCVLYRWLFVARRHCWHNHVAFTVVECCCCSCTCYVLCCLCL
jgi:hypothetical protein